MSDYGTAFSYMMKNEDPALSGVITMDPTHDCPEAYARFGINSAAHPEAMAEGFYQMPVDKALEYAASLYKYRYWVPIGGYQIIVQDIANKFFDLAVNSGPVEATKLVQRAVNVLLGNLTLGLAVDGHCGDKTISAINAARPEELLPAIKGYAVQFYQDCARRLKWSPRLAAAMIDRANA